MTEAEFYRINALDTTKHEEPIFNERGYMFRNRLPYESDKIGHRTRNVHRLKEEFVSDDTELREPLADISLIETDGLEIT